MKTAATQREVWCFHGFVLASRVLSGAFTSKEVLATLSGYQDSYKAPEVSIRSSHEIA